MHCCDVIFVRLYACVLAYPIISTCELLKLRLMKISG